MEHRNRRLDLTLGLGLAAFLAVPWYRIEGGFFGLGWLADFPGDPAVAPGLMQIFAHGKPWLIVALALLGICVAARFVRDPARRGLLLAVAGAAGVLYLAL